MRRARSAIAGVILTLSGCAGSGAAPSLSSATPIEREFTSAVVTWDLNHDGDVTCEEWKRYATGLFREADANRDGILTREEFATLARSDRLFESVGLDYFDANADGRLSLSEFVDKPNPAFALLDKDGDCRITPDERAGIGLPNSAKPGSTARRNR